jgi:hypothetical protein
VKGISSEDHSFLKYDATFIANVNRRFGPTCSGERQEAAAKRQLQIADQQRCKKPQIAQINHGLIVDSRNVWRN